MIFFVRLTNFFIFLHLLGIVQTDNVGLGSLHALVARFTHEIRIN